MAGIVARALEFIAGQKETPQSTSSRLMPRGLTPGRFMELAGLLRPIDYRIRVEEAVRFYRGESQNDTRIALEKAFPRSAKLMIPVALPLIERIIKEQAAVYSGAPKFELVNEAGEPVTEAGPSNWAVILRDSQLHRHMQQTNRLTRLCRRSFVRVTWDDYRKAVKIRTFTPEKVHILFNPDNYELHQAEGILLEVESVLVGEELVRRWEFWCAGPSPRSFIVDERGNISAPGDDFANPYQDATGQAVVPIVSFGDEEDCDGYWPLPRRPLIDLQRIIDSDETNLRHISRTQSHGQWVSGYQENASDFETGAASRSSWTTTGP
jgi:hypothetical protein